MIEGNGFPMYAESNIDLGVWALIFLIVVLVELVVACIYRSKEALKDLWLLLVKPTIFFFVVVTGFLFLSAQMESDFNKLFYKSQVESWKVNKLDEVKANAPIRELKILSYKVSGNDISARLGMGKEQKTITIENVRYGEWTPHVKAKYVQYFNPLEFVPKNIIIPEKFKYLLKQEEVNYYADVVAYLPNKRK
jgi:hypothetical protein